MDSQNYDLTQIIKEIHGRIHPLMLISSQASLPEWNRYLPFIDNLIPHPKESVKKLQSILNPPDRILIFTSFTESYEEKIQSLPKELLEKIDICSIPTQVSKIFSDEKFIQKFNDNSYRVICIDEMRSENYPLLLKAFKTFFTEHQNLLSLIVLDRSFKINPGTLEKPQWSMRKTSELEKKCQLHFHFEPQLQEPLLVNYHPQK